MHIAARIFAAIILISIAFFTTLIVGDGAEVQWFRFAGIGLSAIGGMFLTAGLRS